MKLSALIVTTLTSLVLSCPDQHDQTGHESQTQIFVLPIPPAVKAPVIHPEPVRSTCARYGLFEHGLFTMYNNLWNQPKATGTQCSVLQQGSNQSVSWSTTWNWQPKTHQPNVISYANVEMSFESLSDISNYTSISTRWQAEYTCSNHVANVAYDIFLENEKDGQVVIEIMIWLSAFGGAKPISATGVPIVGITLANKNWQLFKGRNDGSAMVSILKRHFPFSGLIIVGCILLCGS